MFFLGLNKLKNFSQNLKQSGPIIKLIKMNTKLK